MNNSEQSGMTVSSATVDLFKRYKKVCELNIDSDDTSSAETSLDHLWWLCDLAMNNQANYPIDKLSRLLGFVQGVLSAKGFISVTEERDFTRPLFHAAYRNSGIRIPETVNRLD